MLACTQQLPTADRLLWSPDRLTNLPCPHGCDHQQTNFHAFVCPATRHAVTAMRKSVHHLLLQLALPTRYAPGISSAHKALLDDACLNLNWYDPCRPAKNDSTFAGANCADPDIRSTLHGFDTSDRLSGLLGILPPGLIDFLRPDPSKLGVPERAHRSFRRDTERLTSEISTILLSSARTIFANWTSSLPSSADDLTLDCFSRPFSSFRPVSSSNCLRLRPFPRPCLRPLVLRSALKKNLRARSIPFLPLSATNVCVS